jgi:GT2 family glycosyltransferase
MDDYLSPPTPLPRPEADEERCDAARASNLEAYRDFVHRAAAELLAVPDTVMSLVGGSAFRVLQPQLYEKVRQGHAFGVPMEQVHADLMASCAIQRGGLWRRLQFSFIRGVNRLLFYLRLVWFVLIVFPLTTRKMRGPRVNIATAKPPLRHRTSHAYRRAPQASIVVLSYNRLRCLQTTIASFLETVGDPPHELIVVDNGSRDGSVEFLRGCQDRGIISKLLLLPQNLGISAGYNHGFAAADERSEYVMKLDSDIKLLSRGWLVEAMDFLSANRDVGFVALNQINHPGLRMLPPLQWRGRELLDFAQWTCGSAMLIPTRVRQELGCFIEDPKLSYVPDDVDYFTRACRQGYRAFYLRKILVYHQTRYTLGKLARQSTQLACRLADEYDRGVRPLAMHYEKYRRAPHFIRRNTLAQ